MLEDDVKDEWIDCRVRSLYTTGEEIGFLNEMPELMAIRAGTLFGPRKQTDAQILRQYRKYLKTCDIRKQWGTLDKEALQVHCKKLIKRYAMRVHRRGYGL